MTFEQYWEKLCRDNPQLSDSHSLTLIVPAFKKILERAYDKGYESRSDSARLFETIFGGLKR